MPLQIVTTDFDNSQPSHQDLTATYSYPLPTSNYDHIVNSSHMLNVSNDSTSGYYGFMFQSPPVKIAKEHIKILKQQNVGMKKNLKLIKKDRERE